MTSTTTSHMAILESTDDDLVRAQRDLTKVVNRCLASGNDALLAEARTARNDVEDEIIRRAHNAEALAATTAANEVLAAAVADDELVEADGVWEFVTKGAQWMATADTVLVDEPPVPTAASIEAAAANTGTFAHISEADGGGIGSCPCFECTWYDWEALDDDRPTLRDFRAAFRASL